MDLKSGLAQVIPSPRGTLDLGQVPKAVEKAGFSAPKLYLRGTGTVAEGARGLEFRIRGQKQFFLLSGGAKFEQLRSSGPIGRELEIAGELTWKSSPALLSVEDFVP